MPDLSDKQLLALVLLALITIPICGIISIVQAILYIESLRIN